MLLALLWCAAGGRALAIDTAYFVAVGDAESIPDGVVTALAEDAAGFLWIGTTTGLVRFDGYRLRRFLHDRDDPHSLGGNLIRALLPRRDGGLWIGTDADGLSAFDPARGRFTRYRHRPDAPQSLAAGPIFALAEDGNGGLWVGSRGGGLDHLNLANGRITHHRHRSDDPSSLPDDRVHALLMDRGGTLWIGTGNGLAKRRAADQAFTAVHSQPGDPDGLAGAAVYGLLEAADGRIWAGTRDGDLVVVHPITGRAQRVATPAPHERGGTASVFAFAQAVPDEIWLGRSNGLEVREADNGQVLHRHLHDPAVRSSLAGNDVRALLIDRAGLLWAGGFGSGLQRHDPGNRAIRVFRQQPGHDGVLDEPNIVSVLALAEGGYWLGTRGHGVAVLDAELRLVGAHPPRPDRPFGLQAGWITALAQERGGAIWLGSRDGVHRFDPADGRFRALRGDHGLDNPSVRRLVVASDGALLVGTGDGAYRWPRGGERFERFALADDGTLGGDVNAIAEDRAGNLWIGGARGLFVRAPGVRALQPVATGTAPGPTHPSVLGLLVDRDDRLWVDTVEGLFRRDPDASPDAAFDAVSARLGIGGSDFGANLLEDAGGRIWTHRYVHDPATGSLYALGRSDGVDFGTGWFRAYGKDAAGRLLFGGSEGLLVIEPQRFAPWNYDPPLVASAVRVEGRERALQGGELVLAADQRGFNVEFAALDYSAPERLRYRYRLQGFDRDWIAADADYRVASYSNLWPGRYVLRVQGSNRSGRISPHELTIGVRVLPAWWQTPGFMLLALLALLGAGYAGLRWRTSHIRARAAELETLIERRTAELRQAKQAAEDALRDLQGTQRQLVAAEKMASLGQLVAGIAHEINTPIGIAITAASHLDEHTRACSRKLEAGTMTRGDLEAWQTAVDEASRLVLGSLDRAGKLIGSFKQVAVDQTSEQRRQFDLRGFLDEVRFALQPSFKRSGHTLEIDCAEGIVLDTYPGALFQIFTNLVANALLHAFGEAGDGRMRIEAVAEDGHVRLRFSDDGAGMAADTAARAFDPFFTTRRGRGGSGLGLHLVYNLTTRLLGGHIELDSTPGKGTAFTLRIPRRAPQRAAGNG